MNRPANPAGEANNFLDVRKLSGQKGHLRKGEQLALETNRLNFLIALVCAGMMSIFAQTTFAQTVTTTPDRAELLQSQSQVPYGVDGHVASSPNDPDLGQQELVGAAAQYQPFSATLALPIFYTSNAALTPNHELSDIVFAPTAAVYYQPRLTNTLYATLDAREQVFYYGRNHFLNFASMDAEAGLTYFIPSLHNLTLRGGYDFNRLTIDDQLGNEFFSNHTILVGAEVPFHISAAQQLIVGVDEAFSVAADHQSPRRNDYGGYIAYALGITPEFGIGAYGRVGVHDYHQNGRTDVGEIVSLSATYRLTNWLSISAVGTYAHNDSAH
jgi:hypothetical protein